MFGFDLQLDPGLSNLEPSGSELYLLLKFFKRGRVGVESGVVAVVFRLSCQP